MKPSRQQLTQRRHRRIRSKVSGTPDRPRLSVFRSNRHIYAQVIDDDAKHTLAAASTLDPDLKPGLGSTSTCDA
ncbi:MAG: 50S ribosomal protein L18, partial [Chloroflexaceae bacterium]|nr:50S ribosomal protein L18 [Chloroflexaceae bacterium]